MVYGSSGGGRRGVNGGGSSTELHIHRADTRELTAKSSWFCHLLHVSLVGVVAVSYGARRAGAPTNGLLQPRRTTRGRRGLSSLQAHTLCYALVYVASVYTTTLRLGYTRRRSLYSVGSSQPLLTWIAAATIPLTLLLSLDTWIWGFLSTFWLCLSAEKKRDNFNGRKFWTTHDIDLILTELFNDWIDVVLTNTLFQEHFNYFVSVPGLLHCPSSVL